MEQEQGPNKAVIGIIVVVLLATIGGGILYLVGENNADTSEVTTSQPASSDNQASDSNQVANEYMDGTYTATGTYQSPGGQEEIELTVTLMDGAITSTEAKTQAASGTSRQYQQEFIRNYEDLVVGKSINEVELDRVAGSSLTSNGFNDALDEIKQEAAA